MDDEIRRDGFDEFGSVLLLLCVVAAVVRK